MADAIPYAAHIRAPRGTTATKECWLCRAPETPYYALCCPTCWASLPLYAQRLAVAHAPGSPHYVALAYHLSAGSPSMPEPRRTHVPINAGDVMSLRTTRPVLDFRAPAGQPVVAFNAETDSYDLIVGGKVVATTHALHVVAALLRGERYEPGFIAAVLDASTPADELALDADERERRRSDRAVAAAHARQRAQEAAEARRAQARPPSAVDPSADLSDFLTTL